MNKTEARKATLEDLLEAFYWVAVRTTKEENSTRGLTKKTRAAEEIIKAELVNRLGLDPDFAKRI